MDTPLDLWVHDAFTAAIQLRFWARVKVHPTRAYLGTPCAEWTGAKAASGSYGKSAYGNFHVKEHHPEFGPIKKITAKAHLYVWQWFTRKPIPDGQTVDHLCRWTLCVEFTHLGLKTKADNTARGNRERRRGRNAA